MTRRYYSAGAIEGDTATLDDREAHHLLHVARIQPGDRVTLFDGSGWEFAADVTRCGRNTVELAIAERREVCRELDDSVTVGVPLPKGDRTRWLIEKLTELGVTRLTPLTTERSMALRPSDQQKLGRYVIEASKQCGRNVLMEISPPCCWESWLASTTCPARWIAHPGGEPLGQWLGQPAEAMSIGFGPEGGLADAEVEAAHQHGWQVVDLGSRLLRIETAAIAAVSTIVLSRQAPRRESS